MKILFIHNKYGVTSGEEVMLQRIVELLQNKGHDVQCFFKNSADIPPGLKGKASSFFSGTYSFKRRQEIRQVLEDFKPDMVQIQNLFPLISPSILPEIKSHGIPIVMRLSNYRLVCPNGLFLSRGKLCTRCQAGREYWCLLRNCEHSILKSLGYGLRNWWARRKRLFLNNVTLYYAQTNFQKKILVANGFSSDKIDVIPNMVSVDTKTDASTPGDYIAYAGRISVEKGVSTLIGAAAMCKTIPFKLAGEHKQIPNLLEIATDNVEVLGHLDMKSLKNIYAHSRIFIMPSIWYEGFPGVLLEAMLHAKPIICSRVGGLPEIVEDGITGLLFEPGNVKELAAKINFLFNKPELCIKMGTAGREKVLSNYSPQRYYDQLLEVYKKARKLTQHIE